jgi:hypothetical protein
VKPADARSRYPGEGAITADPPFTDILARLLAVPGSEGVDSLEVRWIFPGQLGTAAAGWFGRFPVTPESREDTYLLDPSLGQRSVKVRGGGPLEIKEYRGSPGLLDLAGRACGHLEHWRKWSLAVSPLSQAGGNPPGWRPVRKKRRLCWFSLGRPVTVPAPQAAQAPACAVELTELTTSGQDWWSLGFEATGPAGLLRGELEATAALVFAEPMPDGVKPGPDQSRSYAEWLAQGLVSQAPEHLATGWPVRGPAR